MVRQQDVFKSKGRLMKLEILITPATLLRKWIFLESVYEMDIATCTEKTSPG